MRRSSTNAMVILSRGLQVFLLLCLFAQLLFSAVLKSPTIDEPNHLTRGYAYLKTGDLRLSRDEGHPPLFNLLCAVPLLLLKDLSLPLHSPYWEIGFRNAFVTEFIFGGATSVSRVFFLGRLPVMLSTICLATLVARWARDMYGTWGGTIALGLCVFDPNLIAHGRLVTTDMGFTLFLLLAVYLFWRFTRSPSLLLLISSGIAAGLAQSVKFSAILVLPILGLVGLIEVTHPASPLRLPAPVWGGGRRWLSAIAALSAVMAAVVILAGITVWAVHGLEFGRPAGWPISTPAPTYVEGLSKTLSHISEIGHPAFLMGQRSTKGWWYYFPITLAIKTPLPATIALLCAIVSNVYKRYARAEWALLLIPAIYLGLSTRSLLNIGYRHLLPMLPFLWTYVGRLGPVLADVLGGVGRRWAVSGGLALAIWLVSGTLGLAPNYLAYFNELAGGPDGGWRYLVDSNLDWGQELPAIKAYVDQNGISRLHLSWFGSTYPHLYGLDIEYRALPSHFSYPYPRDAAYSAYNPVHPAPGVYAIGATNLQGVGLAAGDVFARFREQEPFARLGHSIFLYEVPETSEVSHPTCISSLLRFKDLSPATTDLSLGRGPGAIKWFEHTTSFVLSGTGETVYVLPLPPLSFAPSLQTRFIASAEIVHAQQANGSLPAATVYHLDRAAADAWRENVLALVSSAPTSWSPSVRFDADADIHPLSVPVAFDYGLYLVGYDLLSGSEHKPGETIELITVWKATAEVPAVASDLKVFGHLLDEQSQVWAAEDRLDLHPPTWEKGDLLVQYHRLPVDGDAPAGDYQLEIGLYTAITAQRLSVYVEDKAVADRLLLQPIKVIAR
jgi:hypothetical protein